MALARACEEEGADGVSLTNTFLAMAIDIKRGKPVFDNVYAGLSGPAIKPIALRMVPGCPCCSDSGYGNRRHCNMAGCN